MDDTQRVGISAKGRRERKQAEARERMAEALRLRMAGATYQSIADALGYANRKGAHKAIHAAIKDITSEPAREVRELELARLDTALLAIWDAVRGGNLLAIDRFIRLQHQRALLLGLYAPTRLDVTTWQDKVIELLRGGKIAPQEVIDEFGHD